MIDPEMSRYERERRTELARSPHAAGRGLEAGHPLLALQRAAGNRAVAGLVAQRAALQRDGNAAAGSRQAGGVTDVPIGQPPPVTVTPAEVDAGPPAPPGNVTYTGVGSSPPAPTGGGPAPTQQPAPSAGGTGGAAAPTTPATTTATEPPSDDSTPHLDPTLTLDPFNLTLTYTIADLHAFRARGRLVDLDILADPSASLSVSLDPSHAVAGQAAVNIFLMHIKQNGDSVVDLGFGPSVGFDGSSVTPSAQATAEVHVSEHGSLMFTATFTPTSDGHGGYGITSSAVVGAVVHF
jgi:hypothetical protein